jgi:hypothetical protein
MLFNIPLSCPEISLCYKVNASKKSWKSLREILKTITRNCANDLRPAHPKTPRDIRGMVFIPLIHIIDLTLFGQREAIVNHNL